ncbi:iron-sulfur cluster assembly scaffold protein [Candidatus Pacearchaeota archaeon]|nr:iron-sulfur cluster assembly scaffold protein [Candidatus Pacearchaeota archaeon]
MNSNIHRQELLDLYAEKPNYGELIGKTHEINMNNPACSDLINVQVAIDKGKIIDAKFSGETCLISTVSACVLLEKIKGMKVADVLKIGKKDIDKLLNVEVIPTRVECELLALEALKEALNEKSPKLGQFKEAFKNG